MGKQPLVIIDNGNFDNIITLDELSWSVESISQINLKQRFSVK